MKGLSGNVGTELLLGIGIGVPLKLSPSGPHPPEPLSSFNSIFGLTMPSHPFHTRPHLTTSIQYVQVTLLASAVAFSLGAVTGLNSVRWFSAFATLNTIMIMVLMVRA